MASNESIAVIFNFLKFFVIFFEFSITHREGTERNGAIIFIFSSAPNLFWFQMNPKWYFLIFLIFLLFFWNFLLPVGLERNGTIIFIFSISHTFPSYYGLKYSHNGISLYFEFFCYFIEIFNYASGRTETER